MKPVTAISTSSNLSFSRGWVTRIEHNIAEKVALSLLFLLHSITLVIHNVLCLTRVSGSSSVLVISKLMNPALIGKVFIISHCYQDFASASIQFHPISTVPAFKKKIYVAL